MNDILHEGKGQRIDAKKVLSAIWGYRRLYVKVLSIVLVVSCVCIFPVPRTYTCSVMLAPELNGSDVNGSLSSLASSFGVNMGAGMYQDAISPTLYPDLMASTDFVLSLFPVQVSMEDGELTTNYCDYMRLHQKRNIWLIPISWVKGLVASLFEEDNGASDFNAIDKLDAFRLTEKQREIVDAISNKIDCSVDKKTDVITITVTDQDPLVCALIADTLSVRLQGFITNYRTNKARVDMEYYKKLTDDAKREYDKALEKYGEYADSHTNVTLESYKARLTDMENDMQLKYNTYSTMNTQLEAAKAKVQERTPVFTTLQCASVPTKPSGPKRMIFVAVMVLMAFAAISVYVLNKIVRTEPSERVPHEGME